MLDILEVTPINNTGGDPQHLEVRYRVEGEDAIDEKRCAIVYRGYSDYHIGDVRGEQNEALLDEWKFLAEAGMFLPAGADKLKTAVEGAKANGGTVTILWCEGIHSIVGRGNKPVMARTAEAKQNLREICRIAARVFYAKSYDGASMQDIAQAVGLTKAGLYHHVGSKDRLLYEIQNYGMDILDETVLAPIKDIADPREKLRQTIIGHIDLIVRARDQEITVILHENRSLSGPLRKKLNARKRGYIDYLDRPDQARAGTERQARPRSPPGWPPLPCWE